MQPQMQPQMHPQMLPQMQPAMHPGMQPGVQTMPTAGAPVGMPAMQVSHPASQPSSYLGETPLQNSSFLTAPDSVQPGLMQQEGLLQQSQEMHQFPGTQPAEALGSPEPLPVEGVITLTVPDGAGPGTKLTYSAPDGQELRLTVPEGVPPGSVMTLTQDAETKQWKCMAEPPDSMPASPEAPLAQAAAMAPPPATADRVAYMPQHPPVAQAYPSQGPMPRPGMPGPGMPAMMAHAMPVNLSYVPPPVSGPHGMAPAPGQVDPSRFNPPRQDPAIYAQPMLPGRPSQLPPAMEQRPSYTPPPVSTMEQRPSYIPMPQVLPGPMVHGMTGPMSMDAMMGAPKVIMGQTSSYVPPPMPMVQPNGASYVPPVAMATTQTGPAMDGQGPSITTLPTAQTAAPMQHPGMPAGHQMMTGPTMPMSGYGGMPTAMQPMPQLGFTAGQPLHQMAIHGQQGPGMHLGHSGPMSHMQPMQPAMGSAMGPCGIQMMAPSGLGPQMHPQPLGGGFMGQPSMLGGPGMPPMGMMHATGPALEGVVGHPGMLQAPAGMMHQMQPSMQQH
eukprot:gb/GFBE01075617.1/.p1 GENE.gb/GFBE01075617.1/~~gb/GFBE01075617.1/.p1  ORF type:complete len:554 (+),score=65.34 gb/GFBE01075617.1/:1-1662(+)